MRADRTVHRDGVEIGLDRPGGGPLVLRTGGRSALRPDAAAARALSGAGGVVPQATGAVPVKQALRTEVTSTEVRGVHST